MHVVSGGCGDLGFSVLGLRFRVLLGLTVEVWQFGWTNFTEGFRVQSPGLKGCQRVMRSGVSTADAWRRLESCARLVP